MLGNHFIDWEYNERIKDYTTLVQYVKSWRMRPASSLANTGLPSPGAQSVALTCRGAYKEKLITMVLRKQLVSLESDSTPMVDDENQTFLYRVENIEEGRSYTGEAFYAAIMVGRGSSEASCTLTDIPASIQYLITELDNLWYLPAGGPSQTVNPMESKDDIVFTGYRAYIGYFSDTNIIVDRVTPVELDKFQLATKYPDGQPLNLSIKLTPSPALVPSKDKTGMGDGGDTELPAA